MKYKVKKHFAQFNKGDLVEVNDAIMVKRLMAAGHIEIIKKKARK